MRYVQIIIPVKGDIPVNTNVLWEALATLVIKYNMEVQDLAAKIDFSGATIKVLKEGNRQCY